MIRPLLCLPLLLLPFGPGCGDDVAPPAADVASAAPPDGRTTTGRSTQAIRFTDASARLGPDPGRYTGAALVDFDGDAWLDVALAASTGVKLWRGTGGGDLAPVLTHDPGPIEAAGMAWADVDGDRDLDVLITTREGPDRLWINEGGATFVDGTTAAGLGVDTWAEGASFGDLDGDGDLDLVICQGVTRGTEEPPRDPSVGPGGRGNPNLAYRNDGGGHFEDVTDAWGLAGLEGGESFGATLFDIDDDGDLDVFTVHDGDPDQLFLNGGSGGATPQPLFVDESASWLPDDGTSIMGTAVGDFDGDGAVDIYGTTAGSDRLYARDVGGGFANVYPNAIGDGVDRSALNVGWGVAFLDMDHDGDLDVLTAASYSDGFYSGDSVARPGGLVVLRHDGGTSGMESLIDVTDNAGAVFRPSINAWGLATGDIDRDGDIDVLIAADNQIDPAGIPADDEPHRRPLLLINESNTSGQQDWLRLTLEDTAPGAPNPFAVGAVVRVEIDAAQTTTRVVRSGASYLSQNEYAVHAGLGQATRAPVVRVRWPDGLVQLWLGLESGEHTLTRNASAPCCLPDGCVGDPEDACRARLAEVLGVAGTCAQTCEKLASCDLLRRADYVDQAQCNTDCKALPPPAELLQCVIDASCDQVEPCFEDAP